MNEDSLQITDATTTQVFDFSQFYKTYYNIQLFIIKLDVFISLGQGRPKDFEIGIKDLKESIDKTSQSIPNMK